MNRQCQASRQKADESRAITPVSLPCASSVYQGQTAKSVLDAGFWEWLTLLMPVGWTPVPGSSAGCAVGSRVSSVKLQHFYTEQGNYPLIYIRSEKYLVRGGVHFGAHACSFASWNTFPPCIRSCAVFLAALWEEIPCAWGFLGVCATPRGSAAAGEGMGTQHIPAAFQDSEAEAC